MALLDLFRRRRAAYQRVFAGSTDGDIVLADLKGACYASETTYEGSRDAMLIAEGRRQVWLIVERNLHMTDAQLREAVERGEQRAVEHLEE